MQLSPYFQTLRGARLKAVAAGAVAISLFSVTSLVALALVLNNTELRQRAYSPYGSAAPLPQVKPWVTVTPRATATPRPTATLRPTPTPTLRPTATPRPTPTLPPTPVPVTAGTTCSPASTCIGAAGVWCGGDYRYTSIRCSATNPDACRDADDPVAQGTCLYGRRCINGRMIEDRSCGSLQTPGVGYQTADINGVRQCIRCPANTVCTFSTRAQCEQYVPNPTPPAILTPTPSPTPGVGFYADYYSEDVPQCFPCPTGQTCWFTTIQLCRESLGETSSP